MHLDIELLQYVDEVGQGGVDPLAARERVGHRSGFARF
jgi:hypothetical protein